MAFKLGIVQEAKETLDRDVAWFPCEGRVLASEAYPLKIQVGTDSENWNRAWQDGLEEYSKGLKNARARKDFAEQCKNPILIKGKALEIANRSAINGSAALKAVAWTGPTLSREDLDGWFAGTTEVLVNGEPQPAPASLKPADFARQPDGKFMLPIAADPPQEWLATKSDLDRLMDMPLFINAVGNFRRILEDEGSAEEAEELETSGSGLTIKRGGNRSTSPTVVASTS